jgi:hypothetical protein
MPGLDLLRISESWRDASDADLSRALANAEDYAPGVHGLIQSEAARRNLAPDLLEPAPPHAVIRGLRVAGRYASAHPATSGAVFGAVLRLGAIPVQRYLQGWHPAAWLAIYACACLIGVGAISWPLRSYRPVVRTSVAAAVASTLMSYSYFLLFIAGGAPAFTAYVTSLLSGFVAAGILWGAVSGMACGVVWMLNTYRPVYPPGYCANCGYCLRGLPRPRCPECGREFDPDEMPALIE